MNVEARLLIILVCLLSLLFSAAFIFSKRLNNYGIVDVVWTYSFALVTIILGCNLAGWGPRKLVLSSLVMIWSLRLGYHLQRRVMKHHPQEDRRYQALRQTWSVGFAGKMFLFFQAQALSVVFLSIPFWLILRNPVGQFQTMEIIGLVLWCVGIGGEALADRQLERFKKTSLSSQPVCNLGLWRYSRHPNYFFEACIWVSYALIAQSATWGWAAWIAPAVILHLLLNVTGVPITEEQAVRSKGEAYRRYQQTTSVFVPWFPKNHTTHR